MEQVVKKEEEEEEDQAEHNTSLVHKMLSDNLQRYMLKHRELQHSVDEVVNDGDDEEFKHKRVRQGKSVKKHFQCYICNKRFAGNSSFKRHVNSVHRGVKESKCKTCDKRFSSHYYLKYHLENTRAHDRLVADEFQFQSFITADSHCQHIWTIGEELATARVPNSKEFDVNIILKNNSEMIVVGHTPREISRQFTALLLSGGNVTVTVVAYPDSTITHGIRVPCTYIVNGKRTFVQDVKDNIANIF